MAGAAGGRSTRQCSEKRRSGREPAAGVQFPAPPARDALFADLAGRLEVGELEEGLLEALLARFPGLTAVVRVGPEASPSRAASARGCRRWPADATVPQVLACPIGERGAPLGFVGCVQDQGLGADADAASAFIRELSSLAEIPARNALRHARALELAYRDPLTGLYNRRAFGDYLEREERRAARRQSPLSVILLDLDHLKDINDYWGHETGDRSLCALAGVLERTVRRGDVVARLGGDEFAILLPDAPARQASCIGARVQERLAAETVACGPGATLADLGVSFGVSDLAQGGGSAARMVEAADAELFAAKRSGRVDVGHRSEAPGRPRVPHLLENTP